MIDVITKRLLRSIAIEMMAVGEVPYTDDWQSLAPEEQRSLIYSWQCGGE